MSKLKLLAAAALVASASAAQAVDVPFAMPLAPQLPFSMGMPVFGSGSFSDKWIFTAPLGSVSVSGAAISVDLANIFNIDNIKVSLFTAGDSLVAAGLPGNGSTLQNVSVTGGSGYYFKVEGDVTGAPNGFYAFTAVAAPIPEPQTYALMLAGLSAVGFIAMRRRRRD